MNQLRTPSAASFGGPQPRLPSFGSVRTAGDLSEALANAAHGRNNLSVPVLYEEAVRKGEGRLTETGPLVVETGIYTGRSPRDKFLQRDTETENTVWWKNSNAIAPEKFDVLLDDVVAYAETRSLYLQDLFGGSDLRQRVPVRVFTEFAWHSLFIRNLLVRPAAEDRTRFAPQLTIVDVPGFRADPARHGTRSDTVIAFDLTRGIVLIGGTAYAGEIKKAVFSYLSYRLPPLGILPMHCSASVGEAGDTAVFFGLSGTGKTTLSADPKRSLIGDDEHGWGAEGVFGLEGGCYAKTIRLSPTAEPEIYAAAQRFGTILENVVVDPATRRPDFDSARLTENTRAAYPIDFIPNASRTGRAGHPKSIVFLTADAFGVMPPIARLSPDQAVYHFLSGYTAKVAGTERGVTEPQATFSTCFGAPFMPRHPIKYGELLKRLMIEHGSRCFLVNTGWSGGAYGTGQRMPLAFTRALVDAALATGLEEARFEADPVFGFDVAVAIPGIDGARLRPRDTWSDSEAYDGQARRLAGMFAENFTQFEDLVGADIRAAGPTGG